MLEATDTATLKGLAQDWKHTAVQQRRTAAHADLMAEVIEAEIKRRESAE